MVRSLFVSIVLVLFLSACALTPPSPNRSEYFVSTEGGFLFDKENKEAKYGLIIEPQKPIAGESFLEVQYENPAGGEPLISTYITNWGEKKFVLESPPVTGLEPQTNYTIKVFLYTDSSKANLLGIHKQDIQNLVNFNDLGWN